jgi:hypothetical protein
MKRALSCLLVCITTVCAMIASMVFLPEEQGHGWSELLLPLLFVLVVPVIVGSAGSVLIGRKSWYKSLEISFFLVVLIQGLLVVYAWSVSDGIRSAAQGAERLGVALLQVSGQHWILDRHAMSTDSSSLNPSPVPSPVAEREFVGEQAPARLKVRERSSLVEVSLTNPDTQVFMPSCRGVSWEVLSVDPNSEGDHEFVPVRSAPCPALQNAIVIGPEGESFQLPRLATYPAWLRVTVIVGTSCNPELPFPIAGCAETYTLRSAPIRKSGPT